MRLFRPSSVGLLAVALVGACSSSSGPADVIEVDVPGERFQRIGSPAIATVPFSISNRGSASAFVAQCGTRVMAAVDRWNGQTWTQDSGDACLAVYMSTPLELPPGASAAAARSVLQPGRYRLRIGVAHAAGGDLDWSIVSGHFDVF